MSADDQDRTYPAERPVDSIDRAVARAEGYSISRGKPGGSARTRMRKVECTSCGWTCRVSRRWIMAGLPDCPTCKIPLECRDLDDALHDPAQSERLTAAYGDRELAQERRAQGATRNQNLSQCGSCQRFITGPKAVCQSCGYQDGHGFWPTGSTWGRNNDDGIPF